MSGLRLLILAVAALPVFGQIDGVVINGTTGKPQAGVPVNLIHPGQNGMETLGTVTSGPDGAFKISKEVPSPPALLQAVYQDVQYNLILQPGAPSSGVKLSVFNSTSDASAATLSRQHLQVIEPTADGIHVTETFLVQNTGQTTFLDAAKGSVQSYIPKEAASGAKVTVQAPSGMPINRTPEKTSQTDVYKVGYPIKPGETVYEISYALPPSKQFAGKVLGEGQMLMVSPESVTLSGANLKDDGIKDLGQGGTRARVYEITAKSGESYQVSVDGTGTLAAATSGGNDEASEEEGGPPKPKAGQARVYERLPWVLGLGFGILILGGALLFRRSPA